MVHSLLSSQSIEKSKGRENRVEKKFNDPFFPLQSNGFQLISSCIRTCMHGDGGRACPFAFMSDLDIQKNNK